MSVFGIYACDIRLSWVGISVLITDYRSFFHKDSVLVTPVTPFFWQIKFRKSKISILPSLVCSMH